jgi:hypothetical protein
MPAPGHSTAPKFDSRFPRELRRYLKELELLFAACGVATDVEKKSHTIRYVDVDTADLWESLPMFAPPNTYAVFIAALYNLYPGSEDERKWSVTDLDTLIGAQLREGIQDLHALGEYYRAFYAITQFLRAKNRFSEPEQSRAFVRGFQPGQWAAIQNRLNIKFPDHYPDDPYPLEDINNAAKFVLYGTSPNSFHASSSAAPAASSSTPAVVPVVKTEDLTSFLTQFTQTLIAALGPRDNAPRSAPHQMSNTPATYPNNIQARNVGLCNFCGGSGHFVSECPICDTYIKEGKCRRNVENKVVLPGGSYCPRHIPGVWLKDRINEWHKRNPGQFAIGQLSSNTNASLMYTMSPIPDQSQAP